MTDADMTRRVDLDLLISSLRGEARIADRPGQYDRLNAAADVVVGAVEYIQRLTAERDEARAALAALREQIEEFAAVREQALPGFVRQLRALVAARPASVDTDMDGAPIRAGATYYTGAGGTSTDLHRAARPAPVVNAADDQAAAVKAVEQYPTLTVTAWNATPEQAEAIFEAAMDAAYAAAGDIALDGVATLVRRTVTDWTPTEEDDR